jgi:hypothetical protein
MVQQVTDGQAAHANPTRGFAANSKICGPDCLPYVAYQALGLGQAASGAVPRSILITQSDWCPAGSQWGAHFPRLGG